MRSRHVITTLGGIPSQFLSSVILWRSNSSFHAYLMPPVPGEDRRSDWEVPGLEALRGQCIGLDCCSHSGAVRSFRVVTTCDTSVAAHNDASGVKSSQPVAVSLRCSPTGKDLTQLLAAGSASPSVAAAHDTYRRLWVSQPVRRLTLLCPVQQVRQQSCSASLLACVGIWQRSPRRLQ